MLTNKQTNIRKNSLRRKMQIFASQKYYYNVMPCFFHFNTRSNKNLLIKKKLKNLYRQNFLYLFVCFEVMDLEKLLVETDIVRTSRGTRNMTITLTNDSKLIWNEMKKILKKRYPDLRPSMSLFFESMLRRCEIILKKEEKSKKLREKLKNKKK